MSSSQEILQQIGRIVLPCSFQSLSYEEWKNTVRPLTDKYITRVRDQVRSDLSELSECNRYSWKKQNKTHDCFDRSEWRCAKLENATEWPQGEGPRFFLEIGNPYLDAADTDVIFWGVRWWGKKVLSDRVKFDLDHIVNKQGHASSYETKNPIGTAVILAFKELRSQNVVACDSDFIDEIIDDFSSLLKQLG